MADMPTRQWVYRGKLDRVIDGDTVCMVLDMGLGIHLGRGNEGAHLRLLNVDCPERSESGWEEARRFTANWLVAGTTYLPPVEWPFVVRTARADNFGRYLADIWRVSDGRHLNADLLESGHAVEWKRT